MFIQLTYKNIASPVKETPNFSSSMTVVNTKPLLVGRLGANSTNTVLCVEQNSIIGK